MTARYIKVGVAALNQTPLDWRGNRANIIEALAMARASDVQFLGLPEQCIGGYNLEDWYHSADVQRRAIASMLLVLPHTKGIFTGVGLPLQYRNALYNVTAVMCDGRLLGFRAKQHLANDGIHYEGRWFHPWPEGVIATVRIEGLPGEYPIGDIFNDVGGIIVGWEMCEEAFVARRPGARLGLKGVDLIINPSASHFAFGKVDTREDFVIDGSRRWGVTYAYANLLGNEAGRAIYDGTGLITSDGELMAFGRRFSFRNVELTSAVVDVQRTRMSQMRTASRSPIVEPVPGECITVPFDVKNCAPKVNHVTKQSWETAAGRKQEEFTRAEMLGLFDYMRKTRQEGFTNSLSGGVDSSAVTALVSMMCQQSMKELGRDGFVARLDYMNWQHKPRSAREATRRLLTCAYQATENSGDITRTAARNLAKAVGALYYDLDVDPLFKGYVGMISGAIGRQLTWKQDDLPLQNIQARVRAPGIWLLANLRRQILITTSNRSEATKGYCTMDGDTAGGLAPLVGIDKTFLRQWLLWMETTGPQGLNPIAALSYVNEQQPTAELRPAEYKQTDEDDLGPYAVGDALEAAAIRDKMSPLEGYVVLRELFADYSPTQLATWTEKFFRLWSVNQWKRERTAPSFHLDDHNVDPRTGCRFPILSGGFREELEEMWEFAIAEGAVRK